MNTKRVDVFLNKKSKAAYAVMDRQREALATFLQAQAEWCAATEAVRAAYTKLRQVGISNEVLTSIDIDELRGVLDEPAKEQKKDAASEPEPLPIGEVNNEY